MTVRWAWKPGGPPEQAEALYLAARRPPGTCWIAKPMGGASSASAMPASCQRGSAWLREHCPARTQSAISSASQCVEIVRCRAPMGVSGLRARCF